LLPNLTLPFATSLANRLQLKVASYTIRKEPWLHQALVHKQQGRSNNQWEDDNPNALLQAINNNNDDNEHKSRDD
jgi:hypothetical protein